MKEHFAKSLTRNHAEFNSYLSALIDSVRINIFEELQFRSGPFQTSNFTCAELNSYFSRLK